MKLLLFDVDGTLAKSTLKLEDNMLKKLKELYRDEDYEMCIVGGGTYEHITYQIGAHNMYLFKYIFSENGLVTYKNGELYHKNDIKKQLSEKKIQNILNYVLKYIANLEIPLKRGSFVRFRTGMLYITPMGGDCTLEDRHVFVKYDVENNIRSDMIKSLMNEFKDYDIDVRMGGQIGIGLHPKGWDKSYILNMLKIGKYEDVKFYGDRCKPDGNDYPLYSHEDIDGYFVKSPEHTLELLDRLSEKN